MFLAWLFWGFVVGGGLFMGLAAARGLAAGFDPLLAANVLLYLGSALWGLPRLVKLARTKRTGGGGHAG